MGIVVVHGMNVEFTKAGRDGVIVAIKMRFTHTLRRPIVCFMFIVPIHFHWDRSCMKLEYFEIIKFIENKKWRIECIFILYLFTSHGGGAFRYDGIILNVTDPRVSRCKCEYKKKTK